MSESTPLRLFSFWRRTQAVHWGIVRNHRGRPNTRQHSAQISAGVGGKDACTASSESHATPEGSHPHGYRGEVLVTDELSLRLPLIREWGTMRSDRRAQEPDSTSCPYCHWVIPATLNGKKTHLRRHRTCCLAARVLWRTICNRCRGSSVRSHFPWPCHSHHRSRTRSAWHSPAASVLRAGWCSVPSLRDGATIEVD